MTESARDEAYSLEQAGAATAVEERIEHAETERKAVAPRRFDPGRLIELSKLTRQPGPAPRAGGTVLQAATWIGDHRWTRGSPTIEPMIAALAGAWNEDLDDAERERRLRPLVAVLPGTAAVPGTAARLLAELAHLLASDIIATWTHGTVTAITALNPEPAVRGHALRLQRFEAEAHDRARAGWWAAKNLDEMTDWLARLNDAAQKCTRKIGEENGANAERAWRRSGTRATTVAIETAVQEADNRDAWTAVARRTRTATRTLAGTLSAIDTKSGRSRPRDSVLETTAQRLQRLHVALLANLCVRAREHAVKRR